MNPRKAMTGYVTYLIMRTVAERVMRRKVRSVVAAWLEPPKPTRSKLRRLPLLGAVVALGAGAAVVFTRMRP